MKLHRATSLRAHDELPYSGLVGAHLTSVQPSPVPGAVVGQGRSRERYYGQLTVRTTSQRKASCRTAAMRIALKRWELHCT